MPVIKNNQVCELASGAVVLDLGNLAAESQRILSEARAEAEATVRRAREAGEAAVAAAQAAAEREGREQGRREGAAGARAEHVNTLGPQLEAIGANWCETMAELERGRAAILRAAKDDVVLLALALGRKVAHRLAEVDPALVADQVAGALELLRRPADVTVRVHPLDRPLVEELLPELVDRFAQCEHLHLRDDESIRRGGCIVMNEAGSIDATIDTQLDRIAETLVPGRAADATS